MALVLSLSSCPCLFFLSSISTSSLQNASRVVRRCRDVRVLCYNNDCDCRESCDCIDVKHVTKDKRRDVLFGMTLASFVFPAIVSSAFAESGLPEGFRSYTDDDNKFKMLIPQDWHVGTGEGKGLRSLTAFYPDEASTSNVTVVIGGLGADFTKLESFGNVYTFAGTLVNGLDRSWQKPPGVAAKLIDCKASRGLYYVEYSLQKPGESLRHLYSATGMANNGWNNRLYTVTGQFMDEDSGKYSFAVEKAVSSFTLV